MRNKFTSVFLLIPLVAWAAQSIASALPASFPTSSTAWTEQGVVLTPGPPGAWDHATSHGFRIGSIVKKNGVYYMYYGGASGIRSDGGPAFRAIGVATSTDGVSFVKHAGNPIVTHRSGSGVNTEEEGAEFPMVALDDNGNFIMYWTALTETSPSTVKGDIHLAISSDGFNFVQQGLVVPNTVDGGGDEVWPAGVLHAAGGSTTLTGSWHLWYVTDGFFTKRTVALATGATPSNLTAHSNNPVIGSSGLTEWAWPILLANGKVIAVTQEGASWIGPIRTRETTINALNAYSAAQTLFANSNQTIVNPVFLADVDRGVWRMYYTQNTDPAPPNNLTEIRLKTAPLTISSDTLPPAAPTGLTAQ